MEIIQWGIIAVACFFAISWTIGQVRSPRPMDLVTITVAMWWIGIVLAVTGLISAFHLLWIFPVALLTPPEALKIFKSSGNRSPSTGAVATVSCIPFIVFAALAYFFWH